MALTPAESQKLYRERLKAKKAQANAEGYVTFKKSFSEFLEANPNDLDQYFWQAGIEPPAFEDDRGPRHYALEGMFSGIPDDDELMKDDHGSLRRAEFMIGSLLDAVSELSQSVSAYKCNEIKARLAEIEASDLSAPEAKKAALKEAARLNKMLDQLDKQVRITFPQWKVTG